VPHLPLSDPLRWLVLLIAAAAIAIVLWPASAQSQPRYSCKNQTGIQLVRCQNRYHARWVRQLLTEKRRARRQTQGEVVSAIRLGALAYHQSSGTLLRKASCESHLWPWAHNPSGASGLFQFLPSTWASTPFGSFSIWNPFAQALAAAWMHQVGRGGEWVCR
jgi:hypothetical protein